jgi:hypothetical protein
MAKRKQKGGPRKSGGTKVFVWAALAAVVLGGGFVLAINYAPRVRRAADQTNQVRSVVQESIKRQEMVVKAPARKEFSPAFLQMAFGDNAPLLEQIKDSLNKALGENPTLSQGDVAMMLVTYRAEGELRDVAIHVFGNLVPEKLPKFSKEGYWKSQLTDQFYSMGQSFLTLLGREVLILASKEVEKKQREFLEASTNNRYDVVEDYLHDPVSFIAVIPEPGKLFSEHFRPYMAAVLVKGKVSVSEARAEMVTLSFDPRKAEELAQVLSDTRMMAVSLARVRFGGSLPAQSSVDVLTRLQIETSGPTVITRGVLTGDSIEQALPRFVKGLSKGIGRIRRGPGYPL